MQSTKIPKNTLELPRIKLTSRNYWLNFLAKKKWAVKNNFEETIEYLTNLGVDDIFQHINIEIKKQGIAMDEILWE